MEAIGRLVRVSSEKTIAKMNNGVGNFVETKEGIIFIGDVGSYVQMEDLNRVIIGQIENIYYERSEIFAEIHLVGEIAHGRFGYGVSKMPFINSEIKLISTKELELINNTGYEARVDNNLTRLTRLPIGFSLNNADSIVSVDIDSFFGFHFAIFGNTGAGKSNTVARIIQNLFKKKDLSATGAKFVIFDSNGEYDQAFRNLGTFNKDIKALTVTADHEQEKYTHLEIPVWALTADDWAIILHATEASHMPILQRAIDLARIFYDNKRPNTKVKNHILATTILGVINSSDSSPSKIDKLTALITKYRTREINMDTEIKSSIGLKIAIRVSLKNDNGQIKDLEALQTFCEGLLLPDVTTFFENLDYVVPYNLKEFSNACEIAVLYEGSISSTRIQEYTSALAARLSSLQDSRGGKIFKRTKYLSVDEYIKDLLGDNQLLDIDLGSLDDFTAEVVTKVIAKMLLDYTRNQEVKASVPINLIVEEAHRYIKDSLDYGILGYNVFERISKEGRKYGLLLGISSQRPSELSKTVVSQCSNFIIHRVQNPDDLNYIKKMVPYLSSEMVERLTYIPTGTALVFGTAVSIPVLTRFNIANPQPDSLNAKISKRWFNA